MANYTYMVRCSDNTFYTGSTNDLEKRMKQHNGLLKGGAKYTRGRRPVTLVYKEIFETHSQALQREAKIKKLKRKEKQFLINIYTGHG